MPVQLARLALILHALATVQAAASGSGYQASESTVADEVSAETLMAAAELVDYFKAHARRVYARMGVQRRSGSRSDDSRGATGIEWKVRAAFQKTPELTKTQLMRDVLGGNTRAEDLDALMARLVEEGFVVPSTVRGTGRPAQGWRLAKGVGVGAA